MHYNPAFLWRKAGGSARASKPVKKRIDWLTHIAGRCSMLTDVDGSASDLANSCMEMAEMLRDQLSFYEAVRLNAMEVATKPLSRSSLAAIKAARKDSALLPNILTCLVSNIVAKNKEITCAECNAALSVLVHTKEADNMLHISELREEKHRKHVQSNGVIMLAEKLGELSKEKFVEVMENVNPQHLPEKANNIFYNTQAISTKWFMQAFTDLCFLNVAKEALKQRFQKLTRSWALRFKLSSSSRIPSAYASGPRKTTPRATTRPKPYGRLCARSATRGTQWSQAMFKSWTSGER